MLKICLECQYFRNMESMNLGLRCMNNRNSPVKGDFMVVDSLSYSCKYFENKKPLQFEWDQNKNNIEKHKIGFERAKEILDDPNHIQVVSDRDKWEKFDPDEFDSKGIEKNEGNLDPIRG